MILRLIFFLLFPFLCVRSAFSLSFPFLSFHVRMVSSKVGLMSGEEPASSRSIGDVTDKLRIYRLSSDVNARKEREEIFPAKGEVEREGREIWSMEGKIHFSLSLSLRRRCKCGQVCYFTSCNRQNMEYQNLFTLPRAKGGAHSTYIP